MAMAMAKYKYDKFQIVKYKYSLSNTVCQMQISKLSFILQHSTTTN